MDARAVAEIYDRLFDVAPHCRPRTLLEARFAQHADHPSLRMGGTQPLQELHFIPDPRPEKGRVLEACWCTVGGAALTRVPPVEAKSLCRASVEVALVRSAWRLAWETPPPRAGDVPGKGGGRAATDRVLTVWRDEGRSMSWPFDPNEWGATDAALVLAAGWVFGVQV